MRLCLAITFPKRQGNKLHSERQGIWLTGFSTSQVLMNRTARVLKKLSGSQSWL